MVDTYWEIGKYIIEFEQGGNSKATYGKVLLEHLSDDLRRINGKGSSRPNLNNMRMFYLRYPICQKLSDKLSWSHYVELVKIENDLKRNFYEQQTIHENWSIPELQRQNRLRLVGNKIRLGPGLKEEVFEHWNISRPVLHEMLKKCSIKWTKVSPNY